MIFRQFIIETIELLEEKITTKIIENVARNFLAVLFNFLQIRIHDKRTFNLMIFFVYNPY